MNFQILDKKTMKEVNLDDFTALARNNNLMEFDLEGFALQEDGTLLLCDECGRFAYVPREEKYIIRVEERFGTSDYEY